MKEISDHAISGQTDRREGLGRLEDRIRARAVRVIVVESLDRLSRYAVDLPRLFELADFNGVAIHTLDKGRGTRLDVGVQASLTPSRSNRSSTGRTARSSSRSSRRASRRAGSRTATASP